MRPEAYPHPVATITLRETHISWVLLTGNVAYKVKKPVRLDFLDFSTLAARRHYCQEELRLNRRTAPDLYLDVVPITGSPAVPMIGGAGQPIEYALKMRQFPQDAELNRQLAAGRADGAAFRAFGARMVRFHEACSTGKSGHFGHPVRIRERLETNLAQTEPLLDAQELATLGPVAAWLRRAADELAPVLAERAGSAMVRECHGDLHLGNLVVLGDAITAFDCIEFDPALRWIDVIDDVAFLVMDLLVNEREDLAFAFLDSYLQESGDYAGLQLLGLYVVHRSVVRAKVAAVARAAAEAAGREATSSVGRHLEFAERYGRRAAPALLITHGLPASGKSSVAQALVETLPAVRISSDIERKRLAGIGRHDRSSSPPGAGLYDQSHNQATYGMLVESAEAALLAGVNVIADASFLSAERRELMYSLARRLNVPFCIVDCQAPVPVLAQRLDARALKPHDSEADRGVLAYALEHQDPLRADEAAAIAVVDTTAPLDAQSLVAQIRALAKRDRGADGQPGGLPAR